MPKTNKISKHQIKFCYFLIAQQYRSIKLFILKLDYQKTNKIIRHLSNYNYINKHKIT